MTFKRLIEVGKVISKANQAKLRAAMDALAAIMSAAGIMTEAERSFADRQKLLQSAITDEAEAASGGQPGCCYCYVADVFDASFVYCMGGDYYQRDYTIAADGTVTMGTPAAVIPHMTYDPAPPEAGMAESEIVGDVVPLTEADTLRESATARLKLISPGWGSSGYYAPDVLRRDGPAVFTSGMQMFWDHPTPAEESAKPEGSLSKLAAQLTEDARWDEAGATGPGLYASARVFERYKSDLADLAPHIGVSIRASGALKSGEAEGRKGPIVERIVSARSVDFVTKPGAGGQVLQLFEAAGRRPAAATQAATSRESNLEQPMTEAERQEMQALREANTATSAELARLRERELFREARDFAATRLAAIDLPPITRDRLTESLARNPALKDGALDATLFGTRIDEAAAAEARYIAQLTGGGRVRGLGTSGTATTPKLEESQASLEATFRSMGLSESAAKIAAQGRAA